MVDIISILTLINALYIFYNKMKKIIKKLQSFLCFIWK